LKAQFIKFFYITTFSPSYSKSCPSGTKKKKWRIVELFLKTQSVKTVQRAVAREMKRAPPLRNAIKAIVKNCRDEGGFQNVNKGRYGRRIRPNRGQQRTGPDGHGEQSDAFSEEITPGPEHQLRLFVAHSSTGVEEVPVQDTGQAAALRPR